MPATPRQSLTAIERGFAVVPTAEPLMLFPQIREQLKRLKPELEKQFKVQTRRAFEHDRSRDARITAAGYRVLRFTWRQLAEEPEVVAARLAAALVR